MGVIASYLVAAVTGNVDFTLVKDAAWLGVPVIWSNTGFSVFTNGDTNGMAFTSIITIVPIAFATMMEHVGDISAIGRTVGNTSSKIRDFTEP